MAKVGYVPGVFDQLHHGHINFINCAKAACDKLIVGAHTDEFVEAYKRKPTQTVEERAKAIKDKFPDVVVVPIGGYHTDLIKEYKVNCVLHGTDWEIEDYKRQIRYYEDGLDKLGVTIELIPYTKGISTTRLIQKELPSMRKFRTFLFDLDRTLVLENKAMPFAVETINTLRAKKKEFRVVTNNNRYTPKQIAERLTSVGIQVPEEHVFSSLRQVAVTLQTNFPKQRIYVWGTDVSREWLQGQGVNVCGIDDNPDAIAVLYRNNYAYEELTKLCTHVANSKKYVIGNIDFTYPDDKLTLPDTGCIMEMIKQSTGIEPAFTCGKPSPDLVPPEWKTAAVMIGDSLRTDAKFAKAAGIPFIHVCDRHEDATMSHLGVLIDYLVE
jgi:HAD superfamily hydrolase (TIGR01450 family)